jgi:two-component system, sensor histidine kinase
MNLVCDQFSPEILVSDFRLKEGKTGLDAVTTLREVMDENVPAILVSGDTNPDRIREADASGLPFLHKPINPAKLRALINSAIIS